MQNDKEILKRNIEQEIRNHTDTPCCANCKNSIIYIKENRYHDAEVFCMVTGYFTTGKYKDRRQYNSYSPGGKKLICKYEKYTY
ncbi:MAG: hypothetical protein HUJ68_02805 [Clostridia bacterium]|nr:hypothetical protein [Clostridia bacterium]